MYDVENIKRELHPLTHQPPRKRTPGDAEPSYGRGISWT